MNIEVLLTSKDPDELCSLASKLLADLEQQTQAGDIQQLEEALNKYPPALQPDWGFSVHKNARQ